MPLMTFCLAFGIVRIKDNKEKSPSFVVPSFFQSNVIWIQYYRVSSFIFLNQLDWMPLMTFCMDFGIEYIRDNKEKISVIRCPLFLLVIPVGAMSSKLWSFKLYLLQLVRLPEAFYLTFDDIFLAFRKRLHFCRASLFILGRSYFVSALVLSE